MLAIRTSGNALYWATTALVAASLSGIGVADVLRMPVIIDGLAHLGYPAYFATILGVWKVLGSVVIVAPGLPRLKEWAYAGIFYTLSGAAISHAVAGDRLVKILVPLVLLGTAMASRALQPARAASDINPTASVRRSAGERPQIVHGASR